MPDYNRPGRDERGASDSGDKRERKERVQRDNDKAREYRERNPDSDRQKGGDRG